MEKINKLSRKQITEGLDTIPLESLFPGKTKELTHKQRTFAREVAKGSTGAGAYRKAYNTKATPKTQGNQAHKLMSRPDISAEIQAYQRAIEAETHRTPAALRALVIQSLVQVVLDPEEKGAVRVQAAKVLGTVTEVSAFTERRETKIISSSEDAKRNVMEQIRQLMKDGATDAQVIEHDADSLLKELAGDATPPAGGPPAVEEEALRNLHTIPQERPPSLSDDVTLFPDSDPTPSD